MKINITNDASSVLHLNPNITVFTVVRLKYVLKCFHELQTIKLSSCLTSCSHLTTFNILYHILCYLDSEKVWSHSSWECSKPDWTQSWCAPADTVWAQGLD